MGQIREFLIKIGTKCYFWGLIVPKVICEGDFQAYLLALSGDHSNSDPFLGLFYRNSDANKGLFKSPLFVIFRFRVK